MVFCDIIIEKNKSKKIRVILIHKGLIIMVIIGNNNNFYQGNRFMLPREMIHIQQFSV